MFQKGFQLGTPCSSVQYSRGVRKPGCWDKVLRYPSVLETPFCIVLLAIVIE